MTPIPDPEYWRAVAKAIDAEDEKLRLFVSHPTGLGTAREAILRHFLVSHTPEPFRNDTGFIHHASGQVGAMQAENSWTSKQCDLLVHNPQIARPYYAIENMVVVPSEATAAVVEVKSTLDDKALGHMIDLEKDLTWLAKPVFGFAYDGWAFDTFTQKLADVIRDSPQGVPDCIAVHRKNYLFIRTGYRLAQQQATRHRPATHQVLVNLAAIEGNEGAASGGFLDTFLRLLPDAGGIRPIPLEAYLPLWFEKLPLPDYPRLAIADDGSISRVQGLQ